MLVFVSALQSREASKDWKKVSSLCEQTLRSVCGQTIPDFKAILVCNQKPEMDFKHPNLTIMERKFPVPQTSLERMNDKWAKIRHACVEARKYAPCHVMIVDADDWASRRLAEFCAQRPSETGWLFKRSYMHQQGSRWLFRRNGFNKMCGTSSIVHCEPDELPTHEEEKSERFAVLNFGHTIVGEKMEERGTPLAELPFSGAVYNVGTGENDSRFNLNEWRGKKFWLQQMIGRALLTNGLREEFGIGGEQ